MLKNTQIVEFQLFAERTVRSAGAILKSFKENYHIKKTKDRLLVDIATDADYASEKFIIDQIKLHYPEHSILTEETPDLLQKSDFQWIIDPLDGTKEFIRHMPYYYVLLALEYKGKLVCGVGYQPEVDRLFSSGYQKIPQVNGKDVTISSQGDLSKSFVYLSLPKNQMPDDELDHYVEFFKMLKKKVYRIRSSAWDVEGLYNVAFGAGEGFVTATSKKHIGPKWWDIAPGMLMVEAAGGKVTDFHGNPIRKHDISHGIIASNGKIHEALLNLCHYLII
ncbi:inositol monophosphatase [Candidatus Roizmanbacteria bacterium]|nr:inositol monophosphatase [Candidatus Roizmanbacteria bacterium]